MLKRFTGRLVVMVLAGIVFLGLGSGELGRVGLGLREGTSLLQRVVRLSGMIFSPSSAFAAVAETPGQKKGLSSRPAVAPKKSQTKKSKKTKQAKADPRAQGGERSGKATCKRCEPQSLTYARQRSGIMTSRNGSDNGPLTWFASEKKSGRTTDEPTPGSVLILGGQGHGMPTGHVAYVEKVIPESPSTYRVIFSHTNYDRRCHLETDIEAFYNREAMTLDVRSGAWQSWGRGLKVAGFIRED